MGGQLLFQFGDDFGLVCRLGVDGATQAKQDYCENSGKITAEAPRCGEISARSPGSQEFNKGSLPGFNLIMFAF